MTEIKKLFSEYFLTDSRDFIMRYDKLEESATHIGLRTKLVVELMFSLECALKALFIIETELEEKEAYKKIKSFSHNINKILENITNESRLVFDEKVTIDYKNYKVFHRYIFESEMAFREEFGTLDLKYYETINNPTWRQSFKNQIVDFIQYVDSKIPFELKTISISEINIEEEISKFNKLKNILS